jgi:NADPH2:quinone reductase
MHDASKDFGIVIDAPGGPESLEWRELPSSLPAAGEVRIAQRAIGVNFIDTYFRQGLYAWPSTPLILGGEAAGVVDAVGEGVTNLRVGERVAYTLPNGAYRTRRNVAAERVVKLPDGIEFDVAASLMLKGLTAQFLLTSCHPVRAGDTVLVHAAAGGVGLLLGQLLRTVGARAIGTVGSAEKAALALAHGYTHAIDYRNEDFVARVREITAGAGCDVVYDSVGADTWRGSLKSLRPRGMFVCFGQSSGMITEFRFSDLAAGGSLYATRPILFDYIKSRAELESRAGELFARVLSGALKAHIGQRLPLREAQRAHRELEARKTVGSTILLT